MTDLVAIFFLLLITGVVSFQHTGGAHADGDLRAEIETAANESKALAHELKDMLVRLEAEQQREKVDEAAEYVDNNKVIDASKSIIDKIEKLAQVSDETKTRKMIGSEVENKVEGEELRSTLQKLEVVGQQVENVSSTSDHETIDDMTVLLEEVSNILEEKVEMGNNGENIKEPSGTEIRINGIEDMIRTLEKATIELGNFENSTKSSLVIQTIQTASVNETGIEEPKIEKGILSHHQEKKEETEVENKSTVENNPPDKKRGPKELKGDDKAKNKEDSLEICIEKEVSDRIRVCLPKLIRVESTVNLSSGIVREDRHCYDVTKTICKESSQIVSKEACVYNYKQKTVVAPVHLTEVAFERRHQKLGVTRCAWGKYIGAGYREKEIEICNQVYQDFAYRLPTIIESGADLVELSIPSPSQSCQLYRYEVPEVTCHDVTHTHCSVLGGVRYEPVAHYLETVGTNYQDRCTHRNIQQQVQVCTKERQATRKPVTYQG